MKKYEFFVYILKCNDKSYYIGVTNNLEARLYQHNEGLDKNSYTFTRRPVRMVYSEFFIDIREAITREKQLKKWSRKKKEALINENWELIKEFAECRNKSHFKNIAVSPFDSAQGDTKNQHDPEKTRVIRA